MTIQKAYSVKFINISLLKIQWQKYVFLIKYNRI